MDNIPMTIQLGAPHTIGDGWDEKIHSHGHKYQKWGQFHTSNPLIHGPLGSSDHPSPPPPTICGVPRWAPLCGPHYKIVRNVIYIYVYI